MSYIIYPPLNIHIVAVIDKTAGRINHPAKKRVAVGALLVLVITDLQSEKTHHINQHKQRDESADYIFTLL